VVENGPVQQPLKLQFEGGKTTLIGGEKTHINWKNGVCSDENGVRHELTPLQLETLLMGTWMMLLLGGKFLSMEYFPGERSGDIAVAMSFLVMALVPFCYFTYITIVVWRQKLLPLNGQTRATSIYFLRIIVFFFHFLDPRHRHAEPRKE